MILIASMAQPETSARSGTLLMSRFQLVCRVAASRTSASDSDVMVGPK